MRTWAKTTISLLLLILLPSISRGQAIFRAQNVPSSGGPIVNHAIASNTTGTTTITATFVPTTGSGHTICAAVVTPNSSITFGSTPVTDSAGDTFYWRGNQQSGDGGTADIFCTLPLLASSGVTTVTTNLGSSSNVGLEILEISGTFLGFGQPASTGSTTNVTTDTISLVTQAANNMLISVGFIQANVTPTAGNGTLLDTFSISASGSQAAFFYNTATSANTNLSQQMNWTGGAKVGMLALEVSTNAINWVQGIGSQSATFCSATTCTVTLPQPVAKNDTIVATGYDQHGTGVSITFTDGNSNSYTQVKPGGTNPYCNLSTAGISLGMSYAVNGTQSATLAVTMADGGFSAGKGINVTQISGANTSTPFDAVSTCVNPTTSAPTTNAVTTANANELLVPVFGTGGAGTFTAGADFFLTAISDYVGDNAHNVFAMESKIAGAAGGYTGDISSTADPQEYGDFIAAFKH